MKKGTGVLVAVMSVVVGCCAGVFGVEGKFVPPEGKVLLFVGQNLESIDKYVEYIGVRPSGVMMYTSVQMANGLSETFDCGDGVSHGQYLIDTYPNTALQIGLYMVDALDDVVNGVYDDNIDIIGAWIKKSERPVYLRIGYEFDGPHNHYDPEKYVKAFRYIVDRYRENGIDNIAYVWHSNAYRSKDLLSWYPGDEYVDWFGISYFSQLENEMKPMVELAREHDKPLMIAESSPAGHDTSQGLTVWWWYKRYFQFIDKYDVKCASYINCNWDELPMHTYLKWKDNRLHRNAELSAQWSKTIRDSKYLHSTDDLFSLIGYK